ADGARPRAVRRSLARTIGQFASPEAAAILIRSIEAENDGAVLFRILRELHVIKGSWPRLLDDIDRTALEDLADRTQRRLVDDLPDLERLRRTGAPAPTLDGALAAMTADHSPGLRALVEHMLDTERERSAS